MILVNKDSKILDVSDKEFPVAEGFMWIDTIEPRTSIGLTWDRKNKQAVIGAAHKRPKPGILASDKIALFEARLSVLENKIK